MPPRLFLLDAYALIFRAYYALIKVPRLTQNGFNTSAIFGFVNTLEEILRKEKPTHIAVCFDPAGPTFRSEAYKEYKGERPPTPEDIRLSVPVIKDIVRAYNIPILEKEGFEADDVIGTMSKRAEAAGFTTFMMTPDKDFGQLVTPSILQYKPSYRGQDFEIRGEEEVCMRYGLQRTEQVIDYLALNGDKSDNIPGCPGVGEKTATKLLAEFDNIENLLEHTDKVKGKLREKIEENADQIRFSKFLATIRTDVPLDITPQELERKQPDTAKLQKLFTDLEFRSLADRVMRRIRSEAPSEISGPFAGGKEDTQNSAVLDCAPHEMRRREQSGFVGSLFDFDDEATPESPASLEAPFRLPDSQKIVTDLQTLDAMQRHISDANEITLFAVSEGDNDMTAIWHGTALLFGCKAWYIPSDFKEGHAVILDLLARDDVRKLTDSAKLVYVLAARAREEISDQSRDAGSDQSSVLDCAPHETRRDTPIRNFFDVTLAHYLLQPDMRHSLKDVALAVANIDIPELPASSASLPPNSKKKLPAPSPELFAPAAFASVAAIARIAAPLEKALSDDDLIALYNDIEAPLVPVLADMELTGVCIDVKALNTAAIEMEAKINDLEDEICNLAGEKFNVGSPAKVGEILFDKLQLDEKAKKTKTGQYSTSEDILEKVAHKHPIVHKILEYRGLKKLLNTYLTALPAAINPATGRVHTNYNQTVTATGRISSSNPNLQNIPVREDVGREIRRAFIPSPGNLFLSADYSQIELRLVADFANDETMISAFHNGDDIHAITAAKIYHNGDLDKVTSDERRHAKTANFGILYGISAFGLASRLGIPRSEAKELIDNYFREFHTIRKYMSDSVEFAREHGYVMTKMGRKRRLPDINSRNPVVRGYAERNAVNAPVQGSAADIIKKAMIDIYNEMNRLGLKSKMIMQVHDELNFDVVPDELPVLQPLVARLMQAAYSGRVPLTASSGVADNWLDAH